jgi:4-diphosphocytidyl-2-C-methyl-D-erythritol kinase
MQAYLGKAYAKINLGLDVIRRLENGYHEVRMIMQSISLCDSLEIEKTASGIQLNTDSPALSCGADNLVYRAAKLITEECGIADGLKIMLRKRIPCAAGMGGGSSDAAATLHGINNLFELDLPLERLQKMGLQLGADVPYCLLGGTALAEGIGEILTPLVPAPDYTVLTIKPNFDVSTKYVYDHLILNASTIHPDIIGMTRAIVHARRQEMLSCMGNVLESVTLTAFPVLSLWKEKLLELGAVTSLMSGSGPTIFALFESQSAGEYALSQLQAFLPAGAYTHLAISSFRDSNHESSLP